jgi:hypothetical protein
MQMQANLRGQIAESSGNRWTPLGVVRFARAGWDTRLGPSDGALTAAGGVTFAPTFLEGRRWLRMADLSARYEGAWSVQFVHPMLVRCAIDYRPKAGASGPSFRDEFTVTPDGILSVAAKTSPEPVEWGMTWPLLENDGKPLQLSGKGRTRRVQYPGGGDTQNFIALDDGPALVEEPLLRGSYGDLRPVRVVASGNVNRTLIHPRKAGEPEAPPKIASTGTIYVGRTAAGGFGAGTAGVTFSQPCGFVVQLRGGAPVSVEADRAVTVKIKGRQVKLSPYLPRDF